MKFTKWKIGLAIFASIGIIGCGGGSNDTPPSGGKITGKAINYTTGVGLEGVTVKAGSKETTTASDGSYTLTGVANGSRIVVAAGKSGFAPTSKITSLSDTVTHATQDLSLLPIEFTGLFDAAAGFTAQVPGSPGSVVIDPGSLVDTDGNTPSGDITAELTTINPALDINLMPGDMTTSAGNPIASYGAMTVNFSDANGNPLNLSSGNSATIRIPVSSRGGATPPHSIPLFYYDEAQGVWKEDGTATLSADGTYYEGAVTHFSTWNADYLYETSSIQGCVQDENGTRVSDVLVTMNGFNYNGMATATTDDDGKFTVDAMQNGTSLVFASTFGKVSNTVKTDVSAAGVTLSDCLVLGDVPLTVRLTWGKNPYDLDTHVIGPNGYHIWYSNKGNLSEEPFANLDVDDTVSYGPEVFTALSFPEAGTYHYAVYNYTDTHTPNISNSPARVELVLDGHKTIFTPPEGESASDTWWNVFDIIVDINGNISIQTIQTWKTDATGPTSNHKILRKSIMPKKIK